MIRFLQNKGIATKLQILIEVAAGQPSVQQKDIAKKLEITPQWVSEYMLEFVEEGMVVSEGKSKYRVTAEGVDWILKLLREMGDYFDMAEKVIRDITVCAAIAGNDLASGQQVGLTMKDGVLLASHYAEGGAKGIALTDAKTGQDIGISNIEGIVEFKQGKVTILKIPGIHKGGSRNVDLNILRTKIGDNKVVGAIGAEAVTTLKQVGIVPRYIFGVNKVAVEISQCGLAMVITCVDNEIPPLTKVLDEKNINYQIVETGKGG